MALDVHLMSLINSSLTLKTYLNNQVLVKSTTKTITLSQHGILMLTTQHCTLRFNHKHNTLGYQLKTMMLQGFRGNQPRQYDNPTIIQLVQLILHHLGHRSHMLLDLVNNTWWIIEFLALAPISRIQ